MTAGAAAIYAFTPQGLAVGLRLTTALGGNLFAALSLRDRYLASGEGAAVPDEEPADGAADCDIHTGFGGHGGKEVEPAWFNSLPELMAKTFFQHDLHIFIGATGIAVRSIAPLLCSKATDPAVLVVDQQARFVISLLSGHLGGANAWAGIVADLLGATPVITTATDMEGLPAIDLLVREKGLTLSDIASMEGFKTVSASLLAGRRVGLYDPDNWLGLAESPFFVPAHSPEEAGKSIVSGQGSSACIIVTERDPLACGFASQDSTAEQGGGQAASLADAPLILHPPALFIGIGCRLGITSAAILRALHEVYANAGLSLAASVAFASVDAKEREEGLLEAARQLGLPLYFYSTATLGALPVTKVSANVMERFGIPGVCEPAALAAAMGLEERSCSLPGGSSVLHVPPPSGLSPVGPAFFGSPCKGAAATKGGGPDEDRATANMNIFTVRQPEGAPSPGAYTAELLLPKYALNGVTVALAIRRKA